MIKLSDYVMSFLVDHGATEVFMLPGGGAMHLDDSLGRCEGLRYTCFLHEQALAIAAEAYGQHTNRPGVGLVTSGPGSTNAITAVAAGFIDSTPMFMISGQAKRPDLKGSTGVRQMGSQEVDIVSMVGCITKYAVTVMEPTDIRYHLERAWHEATSGRMGPVWLDIPLDVQAAMVDESALKGFAPSRDATTASLPVDEIIKALSKAKRPLILAGNGIKLSNACDKVREFTQACQIPMVLTWKMADFLDYEDQLNFGHPGIMGSRFANFIVQNADLLLILGSRLDPSVTAFNSTDFGRSAFKIMVDIDASEIRKVKGIDMGVTSGISELMDALLPRRAELPQTGRSEWLSFCRVVKEKYPVMTREHAESADQVNLYYFTDTLFRQLNADDVIVPESSGAAGEVTYQAMRVKSGQKIKNAAGLGSMGFGLPYAIGACIANNRRRTILINGDGAFQLNIQELETVARLKLPVKMFIWDNNGYGSIMTTQRNMFDGFFVGSEPASGLTLPDVCALGKAYGLRTAEASAHSHLEQTIRDVLSGNEPVLCKIRTAKAHLTMPKVQAMKLPDGGMASKPLEDMWPYLPAEEVAANMPDGKRN